MLDEETWLEEFLDALDRANVRVRFWLCPVAAHRDRRGLAGELVETVEWRGQVAHCLTPGCGRASADTKEDTGGA